MAVILAYEDYKSYLRILATHADRETPPPYLQDAVDGLLPDDARAEGGSPKPLCDLLADVGKPAWCRRPFYSSRQQNVTAGSSQPAYVPGSTPPCRARAWTPHSERL
jgi:hypothetical protein